MFEHQRSESWGMQAMGSFYSLFFFLISHQVPHGSLWLQKQPEGMDELGETSEPARNPTGRTLRTNDQISVKKKI